MALTKVSRGLLTTSIVDNGNATAITIDSSENVGIATTPKSGWVNNAVQLGTNLSLSEDANSAYLSANAYASSTGWKRVNNQLAGYIRMGTNDGVFSFSNAVTGAADSVITWQERFSITSSGFVGIGTASPTSRLQIDGAEDRTGGLTLSAGGQNHTYFLSSDFVNVHNIETSSGAAAHTWQTNGTERFRIAANGSISIPNQNAINELTFTGTEFTNVVSATTSGFQFGTTGAGYLAFLTNNSEKARILSTGGITFNGDTAQANALDDYEEGTWTPVMTGLGTGGGTYVGVYTKTGRVVNWGAYIVLPVTSDTSFITVSGLPYASLAGQGTTSNSSIAYQNTSTRLQALINQSTAILYFYYADATAGQATYASASGKSFYVGGAYTTA